MLTNRNARGDDSTAEVEDRNRIRRNVITNDSEHMRLFGLHSREYLAMQHQDEIRKLLSKLFLCDVPVKRFLFHRATGECFFP